MRWFMMQTATAVEDDGLVLLAVEVDDLRAWQWRRGVGCQPEGFEGFAAGVELADSASMRIKEGRGRRLEPRSQG